MLPEVRPTQAEPSLPGDHVRLTREGVKVDKADMLRIVGGATPCRQSVAAALAIIFADEMCLGETEMDAIITPAAVEIRTTTTSELWNCQPMNFTTVPPEFWMAKVAMATANT